MTGANGRFERRTWESLALVPDDVLLVLDDWNENIFYRVMRGAPWQTRGAPWQTRGAPVDNGPFIELHRPVVNESDLSALATALGFDMDGDVRPSSQIITIGDVRRALARFPDLAKAVTE